MDTEVKGHRVKELVVRQAGEGGMLTERMAQNLCRTLCPPSKQSSDEEVRWLMGEPVQQASALA